MCVCVCVCASVCWKGAHACECVCVGVQICWWLCESIDPFCHPDSVTSPNFLLKVTKKRCVCVRASVLKGAHACECVCVGANLLVVV